jgi:ASC-1-like (ASCH) protein
MHEIGIQTDSLQQILLGKKTIEGRLATKRFLAFKPGDAISIREDIWRDGKIVGSRPNAAIVFVTQIEQFGSFREMLEKLGYEHFRPTDKNVDKAVASYGRYYSQADEAKQGVVAIHFRLNRY